MQVKEESANMREKTAALVVFSIILHFGQASAHTPKIQTPVLNLDNTQLTRMIINVGSHDDPPKPTDERTAVIAVEPLVSVANSIPSIPNRFIMTAAIADYYGITTFNHWLHSSSLLDANPETSAAYKNKGEKGAKMIVPVLPFSALLEGLSHLECWFIKTDMQHMDLPAIKSAGHLLRNCQWVYSEVQCEGFTYYEGSENDYDEHWLPYMKHMGFVPVGESPCKGPGETNALFKNVGIEITPAPTHTECPQCYDD